MRRYLSIIVALLLTASAAYGAVTNFFQEFATGAGPQAHTALTLISDKETSAANTALTLVYDIQDIHNSLSVFAVCSAGTAALTISVSVDGTTFTAVDSVSAATTTAKAYGAATAGATVAVSPLSFRYVKFSEATCGSSNTSTMTVSGK